MTRAYYSILQYQPSLGRMECVNFGVVLWLPWLFTWRIAIDETYSNVARVAAAWEPGVTMGSLREEIACEAQALVKDIGERLKGEMGTLPPDRWLRSIKKRLRERYSCRVAMTDPRPCTIESGEAMLEATVRDYLNDLVL